LRARRSLTRRSRSRLPMTCLLRLMPLGRGTEVWTSPLPSAPSQALWHRSGHGEGRSGCSSQDIRSASTPACRVSLSLVRGRERSGRCTSSP
jgi:hypothetical protein